MVQFALRLNNSFFFNTFILILVIVPVLDGSPVILHCEANDCTSSVTNLGLAFCRVHRQLQSAEKNRQDTLARYHKRKKVVQKTPGTRLIDFFVVFFPDIIAIVSNHNQIKLTVMQFLLVFHSLYSNQDCLYTYQSFLRTIRVKLLAALRCTLRLTSTSMRAVQ